MAYRIVLFVGVLDGARGAGGAHERDDWQFAGGLSRAGRAGPRM